VIFLSHIHGDHTGGIGRLLQEKCDVDVYVPTSFPATFKETLTGARVKEVSGASGILSGVYTTGELGSGLIEQSLVLKTRKGLVAITGCAHPGIVNMVRKAKEITGDEIVYLVMGGFHLAGKSEFRLKSILAEFRRQSVQKVAPCHCTGDEARRLFKQEYGAHCIEEWRQITIQLHNPFWKVFHAHVYQKFTN
jgi:7,8-dihydropterin-6-yl-methyl-4-(beta-D-ribofuranosyl)aminobenzene 5'-phosphate synthase